MAKLLPPLFFLLAHATDKSLAKYLEYLKIENRILRNKLPRRITITPSERAKLVKHGKPLGKAIKDLISHESLGGLLKHYERKAASCDVTSLILAGTHFPFTVFA
jgi:hypothetical protein